MSALRDYIARLKTVTVESQEEQIFKIVKDNEASVLDLNLSQLENGLTSEGSPVEPPYREFTKEIKKEKGQRTDRVTLRDEGDFYGGFFFETKEFPIGIWSRDQKTIPLTQKYSHEIFGLTQQNQSVLNMDLLPEIQYYYRKILLL